MKLRDGRVLLVGGPSDGTYTTEIWDPETGQWATTGRPSSVSGFGGHQNAVLLADGRILVTLDSQVELFDPDTGSFRQILDPFRPLATVPVMMSNGRVLLATSVLGGVIFDPAEERFTNVGMNRSSGGAEEISAVALADGRVLIVEPPQVAVYDPDTDEFTRVKPAYLLAPGVALASLQDGRVLATGGEDWSYDDDWYFPHDRGSVRAQVFDPSTDTFTAVGSMMEPRSHHAAVTLADGRVVIVGGADDRVEVFDPETATFKRAPSLTRPRNKPSVALLDDGNLLVVGGSPRHGAETFDNTTFLTAETYHPARRSGAPSSTGLTGFTMGLLIDLDEPPNGGLSVQLDVPPGGLKGVTSVVVLVETWRAYVGGGTREIYFYPEGGAPGPEWWWGEVRDRRPLPPDCESGCELREVVFFEPGTVGLRVQSHVQYEGDIPIEASGITLTVVDEEGF